MINYRTICWILGTFMAALSVLMLTPLVVASGQDAIVIGIPHPKWGETPLAMVISRGGTAISEEQLLEWVNPKLAKYQQIARVEFCDDFPRNALGKVLKRELRAPYWEGQ